MPRHSRAQERITKQMQSEVWTVVEERPRPHIIVMSWRGVYKAIIRIGEIRHSLQRKRAKLNNDPIVDSNS